MERIELHKNRHFTKPSLKDWLNRNYAKVLTGRPNSKNIFTLNDVNQYCNLGRLPKYIGDVEVVKVYIPFLKINVIELIWDE